MGTDYRLTRLRVTNYRGIEALDQELPPGGITISGRNGGGKTSVIKAIGAALAGRDIGPDAIRLGAERAEILVNLDHVTVRRLITQAGASLSVVTTDGDKKGSPQKWLNEVLCTAAIDPIELFKGNAKERRATILAALPVKMTPEQLKELTPEWHDPIVADLSLHGLDVCELLRKRFYAVRTEVNAQQKLAAAAADRVRTEAAELAKTIPADAPTAADARTELSRASADLSLLQAKAHEASAAETRQASTRYRIESLRAEAATKRSAVPEVDPETIARARRMADDAADIVKTTEAAMNKAIEDHRATASGADSMNKIVREWERKDAESVAAKAAAAALEAQAAELEDTIKALAGAPVAPDMIQDARTRVAKAEEGMLAAGRATDHANKLAVLKDAEDALAATITKAGRLTTLVDLFAKEAPAKLLAASQGIPGLTLDGDKILLDGVEMDGLCGQEQLLFAVDVARRANTAAKILIVDGIERVDPDQMPAFIKAATADGYQLIATRVDAGDVVLEAIEIAPTA